MALLHYLIILISYDIYQCLPLTNRLAPDGLKGAIKNVRLTDVSSSDAGCRKYYKNWFLMIHPFITNDEALPVRSTNAVAAGILAYMGCAFDCMDLRSHAEMTRTSVLRRADEHRIRGSLRMHCPEGEYIHFYGEYNSIDADYGSFPPQVPQAAVKCRCTADIREAGGGSVTGSNTGESSPHTVLDELSDFTSDASVSDAFDVLYVMLEELDQHSVS